MQYSITIAPKIKKRESVVNKNKNTAPKPTTYNTDQMNGFAVRCFGIWNVERERER